MPADYKKIRELELALLDPVWPTSHQEAVDAAHPGCGYPAKMFPDYADPATWQQAARDGLITRARIEQEAVYREGRGFMPSLVQRMADAEAEARLRWPAYFKGDLDS